jgi:hypothetical protein
MVSLGTLGGLARCHGYVVAADGRHVGAVETPVFADATAFPDYLLVRTAPSVPGTFRVVPTSCVEDVDPGERLVALAMDHDQIAALPERVPLQRR